MSVLRHLSGMLFKRADDNKTMLYHYVLAKVKDKTTRQVADEIRASGEILPGDEVPGTEEQYEDRPAGRRREPGMVYLTPHKLDIPGAERFDIPVDSLPGEAMVQLKARKYPMTSLSEMLSKFKEGEAQSRFDKAKKLRFKSLLQIVHKGAVPLQEKRAHLLTPELEEAFAGYIGKTSEELKPSSAKPPLGAPLASLLAAQDVKKVDKVDGQAVRDRVYPDFTQGGNDQVYPGFVPEGHVWVEEGQKPRDELMTLRHELRERLEMLRGKGYNQAHKVAIDDERVARSRETGLPPPTNNKTTPPGVAKVAADKTWDQRAYGEMGYMRKEAAVGLNAIRSALKGAQPLFHMVAGPNVKRFVAGKGTLKTPWALAHEGAPISVEGGFGMDRSINDLSKLRAAIPKVEGKADISGLLLPSPELTASEFLKDNATRNLARKLMPGVVGDYNRTLSMAQSGGRVNTGGVKNFEDLSFSRRPLRAYGDVGLMTGRTAQDADIRSMMGAEVRRRSSPVPGKPWLLNVPEASGRMVYDPRSVAREQALELKRQGALPLNPRFFRRLRAVDKSAAKPASVDLEKGNVSYDFYEDNPAAAAMLGNRRAAAGRMLEGDMAGAERLIREGDAAHGPEFSKLLGALTKEGLDQNGLPEPLPPYKASEVMRYLLGRRKYGTEYLTGEVDEFKEALAAKRKADIEEELQDSMYALQMLAYQGTGRDRTLLGADDKIKAFIDRRKVFKDMFAERGLDFNSDYLKGGSNWKKPEKIQKAFELAGSPISLEEAAAMRDRRLSVPAP